MHGRSSFKLPMVHVDPRVQHMYANTLPGEPVPVLSIQGEVLFGVEDIEVPKIREYFLHLGFYPCSVVSQGARVE